MNGNIEILTEVKKFGKFVNVSILNKRDFGI